jgi:hypothetical protein
VETGEGQPYVDEVMVVVRRALGRRGARRPDDGELTAPEPIGE